jgi:hypothetical protein
MLFVNTYLDHFSRLQHFMRPPGVYLHKGERGAGGEGGGVLQLCVSCHKVEFFATYWCIQEAVERQLQMGNQRL